MLGTTEKVIYYEPAGRVHPSQWELINHPPDGYKFVVARNAVAGAIVNNSFVFDKLRLRVLDTLLPLNLVKSRVNDIINKPPKDTELLYLYNCVTRREIPWVVNVEWSNVLVGRKPAWFRRGKRIIERYLSSGYCIAITTWSETAMNSILRNYDYSKFKDKLHVVLPAVSSKMIDRDYRTKNLRFLFVGALNDPMSFYAKGGEEAVHAWLWLRGRLPDTELTIRSRVPNHVLIVAQMVPGLRLLTEPLTQVEMDEEYKRADVFIAPAHKFHNMSVLDAMGYGLPVITTDIGSSFNEFVTDDETGIVVPSPKSIPYFVEDEHLLTSETTRYPEMVREIERHSIDAVPRLAEAMHLLATNGELRERLGRRAKWEVDEGKFSIGRRNQALKEIFDGATSE